MCVMISSIAVTIVQLSDTKMKYFLTLFAILSLVVFTTADLNQKCTTPGKKNGLCTQFSKCYELRKLATSKRPSERKYLRDSQCGFLVEALVCCPNVKIEEVGGDEFCLQIDLDKIAGGVNTDIDEFRWMAQLEYKIQKTKRNAILCAGSIINKRFILTAAHCLNQKDIPLETAILGEWDTRTDPDMQNGKLADPIQRYKVRSWIAHPQYNKQNRFENDIGLVKVNRQIVYSDWIKPICVPNSESLLSRDLDGFELTVSGWGRTSGRSDATVSPIKLKADISGTSMSYCQEQYRKINPQYLITNSQFCAFKPGVDACRGDSGGPVMAKEIGSNNQVYMYIAGIVSYGPESCGGPTIPGVYTKVTAYIPWIKENL